MSSTVEAARTRKINKKLGLSIDTDVAESIHSDEPDPPTSPHLALGAAIRHGVAFELLFPCLTAPTRLLRAMTRPQQLDEMKTVVPVFCSSVGSIIKTMGDSHFLLATCAVYVEIQARVSRRNTQLGTYVESITLANAAHGMSKASKMTESVVNGLQLMLQAMEVFHRMELKPLPPLPAEENYFTAGFLDATIYDESLKEGEFLFGSESPTSDTPSGDSQSTLVTEPAPESPKKNKPKFVFRVLGIARHTPKAAATDTTKVADSDSASFTTLSSSMTVRPAEELPYTARQSMYYHDSTDPLHPDARVNMPLPVGDSVAIRLDSNGDVKAASLPALIQLLTSHHKLDEDAFRRTFFLSFRLFSTPLRVLAAIRKRWNEPPPAEIASDAQRRVWLQHVIHIRTRLAQLILLWLDEFWRPATDSVVIEPLRFFVKNSFVRGVVAKDVQTRILAALDRVEAEADAHIPRLHRAREEAQREGPAPPPLAPAVPFDIVLRAEDDYTLNISVFETAAGRERFAEQLTAVAHELYRTIDAEGAVAAWSTGVSFFHELQKFEEDLLVWVVQSILELQAREERVCMMEFWLDVATICVRYRNFSGASAIFGGLVFSPVERLSLTILDLSIPSKEQYRKLNTLLDGANNFSVYRRTLFESPFPAVPLLSVFRKDTVSLTEISGPIALTDDPDAEKSLIHVSVFRILEKTIRTMECFLGPYQIDCIPMIQDWIQTQLKVRPCNAEDSVAKMDALSRALEGRAPHPIQKGQVWLVTLKGNVESGAFTLHPLPEPFNLAVPTPKLRKNKSIATLLNLRTKRK